MSEDDIVLNIILLIKYKLVILTDKMGGTQSFDDDYSI